MTTLNRVFTYDVIKDLLQLVFDFVNAPLFAKFLPGMSGVPHRFPATMAQDIQGRRTSWRDWSGMTDFRAIIGVFFGLMGLLLVGAGAKAPDAMAPLARTKVNLRAGAMLLSFGGVPLWFSQRRA